MRANSVAFQRAVLLGLGLTLSAAAWSASVAEYAARMNAPITGLQGSSAAAPGPSAGSDFTPAERSAQAAFGARTRLESYAKGLSNLSAAAEPTMRGAREVAVYAKVSPSVVLILNGDSLGSGTLLDELGTIVTNWHVVQGASKVGVIFKPSTEGAHFSKSDVVTASVIRIDQVADLALIRVEFVPPQARPATLSPNITLQVGDDVHAIGHPTGEAWTYTRGIVSQIRRNYQWTTEDHLRHQADVIQTQTPINPGNSGGPLISNEEEVVGVNSFKGEGEGLNFAVSANAVVKLLAATTDRLSEPVKVASTSKDNGTCEPKVLKSWRMDDPPGTATLVDADCHGSGDMIFEMPDDTTKPELVLLDSKHVGKADTVMVCPNRDNYPEYALYDTNGSGKPNMIGYFRNHEYEPYRTEPYSP